MVERQLRRRGVTDERVLSAMGAVPREHYVPDAERERAYDDQALPIGFGQTISQPWIVAAMCSALQLQGHERVLEVGAGMGYSTAVLARLCDEVTAIERVGELSAEAARRLAAAGVQNASVIEADGSVSLPAEAPFDAIAVNAAAPAPPPSLLSQVGHDGRLVMPVASGGIDMLSLYRRTGSRSASAGTEDTFAVDEIGPCRFVPLIGAEGFASE